MLTDTVPDEDTAMVAAAAVASSGISQKPTISSVPQTKYIDSRVPPRDSINPLPVRGERCHLRP